MDLFELFDSVEELEERIKGVPEPVAEEEVSVERKEPETESHGETEKPETEALGEMGLPGKPVMQKCFRRNGQTAAAVVAYLDYNMVYLADWNKEPVIWQFEQSKDAVDFYVKWMEHFSSEKQVIVQEKQEVLQRACVRKWTGDGSDETGDAES